MACGKGGNIFPKNKQIVIWKWKMISRLFWSVLNFLSYLTFYLPENYPPSRGLNKSFFFTKRFLSDAHYLKSIAISRKTLGSTVASQPHQTAGVKSNTPLTVLPNNGLARAADVRSGRGLRTQTSQRKIGQNSSFA